MFSTKRLLYRYGSLCHFNPLMTNSSIGGLNGVFVHQQSFFGMNSNNVVSVHCYLQPINTTSACVFFARQNSFQQQGVQRPQKLGQKRKHQARRNLCRKAKAAKQVVKRLPTKQSARRRKRQRRHQANPRVQVLLNLCPNPIKNC